MKIEEITITFHGDKAFCQMMIDKIYITLMDNELQASANKGSNGFTITSTVEPSEEVIG